LSRQVTINGNTYTLNEQGDNPPFGEQQSELISALVDVSNSVVGTGDILQTSFSLANDVTEEDNANVTGLQFDTSQVRSAIIEYSIYRSTSSDELSECGTMLVTYKSTASSWEVARYSVGDAGVTFTLTSAGQAQYTSSDMAGTGYSGLLKFRARSFTQI
jgi:hypothetical protein